MLNKKYNGDSHKVDIKAVDGVTFNPVFTRKGDKVDGTVSVEGKYDPCAWASMKLKYTIATAGNLTTKMTVSKMAPGVDLSAVLIPYSAFPALSVMSIFHAASRRIVALDLAIPCFRSKYHPFS